MLIRVKNLSIAFNQNVIVKNISFEIGDNEIFALMGESGSGKSITCLSLLQMLNRATYPEGEILFQDKEILKYTPEELRQMRGKDIAYISQEPALNPGMPVYKQIQEVFYLHHLEDKTEALLMDLGLTQITKKTYPHELSGGQKQRVMIAIALALDPKLIIADEPTTSQDKESQINILNMLKNFKKTASILLISHDFTVIKKIADRVGVMKDGVLIETFSIQEKPKHPYSKLLIYSDPSGKAIASNFQTKEIVLDVQNLTYKTPLGNVIFDNFSFQVKKGETLGVMGSSGSGKTTLANLLVKLYPVTKGKILYYGKDIVPLKEKVFRLMRPKIQMILQTFGLNPRMKIVDSLKEVHPVLDEKLYFRLGLGKELLDLCPHQLSGGQKQRVALYRSLRLKPEIVIFDEPTSSLDRTIQKDILLLLKELQKDFGLTYIFISHDKDVIDSIAHEVLVL